MYRKFYSPRSSPFPILGLTSSSLLSLRSCSFIFLTVLDIHCNLWEATHLFFCLSQVYSAFHEKLFNKWCVFIQKPSLYSFSIVCLSSNHYRSKIKVNIYRNIIFILSVNDIFFFVVSSSSCEKFPVPFLFLISPTRCKCRNTVCESAHTKIKICLSVRYRNENLWTNLHQILLSVHCWPRKDFREYWDPQLWPFGIREM